MASDELAQRVEGAERGLIVAGGWAHGSAAPILELAARAGWPLIAEPHSNARQGPMALRATDALLRDDSFTKTHRPDLVVVVGRVGLSRTTLGWLADVPHVVISPDRRHWDVAGAADAVSYCALDAFNSFSPRRAAAAWTDAWRDASATVGRQIDAILDASPRVTEPQVARDVAALIPAGSNLVVASSMPIRDLDLVMSPRDDITIYANRGVSGIDGFTSTAQGIAIARPDAPTVALCGDLSLLHDINGLIPGSKPRPDVTYVVINNNGGGIFSLLPQGAAVDPVAFERLFGTPHGLSIAKLADAYEVGYALASTPNEVAHTLSSYGGVRIIEVQTNRAENAALHDQLRGIRITWPGSS